MKIDLLTTVESGGCSAKLNPKDLEALLQVIPKSTDPNLLVDIDTHDDAAVYKINEDTAIITTTDFFPPICSDPYEFGQIAAANSLSDVYAMGGKPLTALNIMMYPSVTLPLEGYSEILRGGYDKAAEAGCLIVGGHSIEDYPPKYGLAVTGTVHPDRVITNANAQPGDILILTKPIGSGILVAGHKLELSEKDDYQCALDNMKLLNSNGAELMQKYSCRAATDVTGFSLAGHALKMALASKVSIRIDSEKVPLLNGALALADSGCIPCAAFRNEDYVKDLTHFSDMMNYSKRMLMLDAQTSGGLLICAKKEYAGQLLQELKNVYPYSAVIGEVTARDEFGLYLF